MIREATKKDKEGIGIVLKESYNIDTVEEGSEAFLSELSKGVVYLVAEVDGKIAGITTWYMHGLSKHGLAELDRIAVLPEFRGKGVAKELFEGLIESAKKFYESKGKKLRKLYLLTHESNARAHAFYEKIGFSHETTLKDHYYSKEDERVYSIFF